MLKSLQDRGCVEDSDLGTELALQSYEVAESAVLAVVEHEVEILTVHESHLHFDDERFARQQLKHLLFAHHRRRLVLANQVVLVQLLDRHKCIARFVSSQVHLPEGAFAHILVKFKVVH